MSVACVMELLFWLRSEPSICLGGIVRFVYAGSRVRKAQGAISGALRVVGGHRYSGYPKARL